MGDIFDLVNYQIAPLLLITCLTPLTQYLVWIGRVGSRIGLESFIGNQFSWKFVTMFCTWALFWLYIPSKKFTGPVPTTGKDKSPVIYQANGEFYYFLTTTVFIYISLANPSIPVQIFENMGPILATLNLLAVSISVYLLFRGHKLQSPESGDLPIIYQFYHGLESSPKMFGVDVKQFTNCRVGMMMWQLLIVAFFLARLQKYAGFSNSLLCNVLLQSFYIYMFFRWETGYFNTLDFTMDKTGWMLVWGCLAWIPSLYTFSTYFLVQNARNLGIAEVGIFIVGLLAVWFHSEADRQKESFKNAKGKPIKIWGKTAKTLEIVYKDVDGQEKKSQLLISGWWGIGRKMNYSLDILSTLSWCLYAGFTYAWPYLCWIFVTNLLIHRVFRDEEKCRRKYGKGWEQYCAKVKYRMIPYVF